MKQTAGFETWKARAKSLKREIYALSLAARDSRVPWYAKAFAFLIIGYALSPIDLIPDFIPVIGYLDDLILIPAGIVLLIRMVPKEVMEECREKARNSIPTKGKHLAAAFVIVLIWIATIYLSVRIVRHFFLTGKIPG